MMIHQPPLTSNPHETLAIIKFENPMMFVFNINHYLTIVNHY